jgi:Asp-tRNA(Asn)/Glu-tRNA(Gln) amidotransferase A subunit family amidase
MGIQLAGRRGEDERLLALAQIFHAERDWPGTCLPSILDGLH